MSKVLASSLSFQVSSTVISYHQEPHVLSVLGKINKAIYSLISVSQILLGFCYSVVGQNLGESASFQIEAVSYSFSFLLVTIRYEADVWRSN